MPQVTYGPAEKSDQPRLREIFLLCFGSGSAAEADYVFSRFPQALWCAKKEGVPAAMLAALPVTLALPQKTLSARYFYGVATHPEHRKQGLCGGLLRACCAAMEKQGEAAALLRPDSEKNRRFYAENGFSDCGSVAKGLYTAKGTEPTAWTAAEPERYDALRRKFAPWGLQWGSEGLAFQKGWLRLYGGDLWLLGTAERPLGCAAVSREEELPLVRELLCAKEDAAAALEGLCRLYGCERLRLALPEPMTVPMEDGRTEPMMMLRPTGASAALPGTLYTPLAMD